MSSAPATAMSAAPLPTLVVGGIHDFFQTTLRGHLRNFVRATDGRRIDPVDHWEYQKRLPDALPKQVELVVLMTDMIGHSEQDQVSRLIGTRPVAVVRTRRKLAEMRSVLTFQGFRWAPEEETNGAVVKPAESKAKAPALPPLVRSTPPVVTASPRPLVGSPPIPLPPTTQGGRRTFSLAERSSMTTEKLALLERSLLGFPARMNEEHQAFIRAEILKEHPDITGSTNYSPGLESTEIARLRREMGIEVLRGRANPPRFVSAEMYERFRKRAAELGVTTDFGDVRIPGQKPADKAKPPKAIEPKPIEPKPIEVASEVIEVEAPVVPVKPVEPAKPVEPVKPAVSATPVPPTPAVVVVPAPVPPPVEPVKPADPVPPVPVPSQFEPFRPNDILAALRAAGFVGEVMIDLSTNRVIGRRKRVVVIEEDVDVVEAS